jgi:hypothetical protein
VQNLEKEVMHTLGLLSTLAQFSDLVIKHGCGRFDLEEPVKLGQGGFVSKLLIDTLIKD